MEKCNNAGAHIVRPPSSNRWASGNDTTRDNAVAAREGEDGEWNAGFAANAAQGVGAAVEQHEDGEQAENERQPEAHACSVQANRSRARSWAFRASSSRLLGSEVVTSESINRRATAVTSSTA